MRILGIDPGTNCTGIGIVDTDSRGQCSPVFFTKLSFRSGKLEKILPEFHHKLDAIVDEHKPDQAAIEDIFYAVNVKSTIKLAHFRGAAIALLGHKAIPVSSYTPLQVKKTIAGYGRAEKEQIRFLIENMLSLDLKGYPLDVSDALGVAVCHAQFVCFKGLNP